MKDISKVFAVKIIAFISIVLFLPNLLFALGKVNLSADRVFSQQDTEVIIASGNVVIEYEDIAISAQELCFDTHKNIVWGTGNILVSRGEDMFKTKHVFLDLKSKNIKLRDISLAVQPPDSKEILYIRAKTIEDDGTLKKGRGGVFTSCKLPKEPHYAIYSDVFEYYTNDKVIGYNNWMSNAFAFVPLYSPYYYYELGQRDIVWNFPSIGKKETPGWGWFAQNTIDYNNIEGKDSSILVDWFENKGIGLGAIHQYKWEDNRGELSYYQLNEADTLKLNEKMSWFHKAKLSDPLSVDWKFNRIDAERINSSGRQKRDSKEFNVNFDDLGDKYNLSIKENQEYNQNIRNLQANFGHDFNGQKIFNVDYSQGDNFVREQRTVQTKVDYNVSLPGDFKLDNKFDYDRVADMYDEEVPDDKLRSTISLSKPINKDFSISILMDHLWDLDEDRNTDDQSKNNFMYKMPEVNIKYSNIDFGFFRFTEEATIARYQEYQYDRGADKTREFPDRIDFNIAPNTYIFKQGIDSSAQGFSVNANYDQYIFSTPGKSLFEGDALYNFRLNTGYSNTFFNCIKTSTKYNRVYSPEEGNTPFYYFDGVKNREVHDIAETLTFYFISESKFRWYHTTGYNWLTEDWNNYNTGILISPVNQFLFKADTGKYYDTGEFQPLSIRLELKPTANTGIYYNLRRDINVGEILSTDFKLSLRLGGDPNYSWDIEAYFLYNYDGPMRDIDFQRYEMQTLQLVKNDHCRKIAMSYNKRLEEFSIKFIVDAFPNDPIGFKKEKEVWKVEGILDDQTAERF
jgi:hypothetical protein